VVSSLWGKAGPTLGLPPMTGWRAPGATASGANGSIGAVAGFGGEFSKLVGAVQTGEAYDDGCVDACTGAESLG